MTKDELAAEARLEGSEHGPLGEWPPARLPQRPEAGEIIHHNGAWYVAIAGTRKEGYKGNFGGLYARWVQVPEGECEGWEPATGSGVCSECGRPV